MSEGTSRPSIAAQRLYNQRLVETRLRTPGEVVAWLGAVQAQEFALSKWALGLRLEKATDDVVEQAFTEGAILRTHAIRPTWHFVTPADIRWLLALTAPRIKALFANTYRQLELDEALFARANAVIAAALEDGQHLTRTELAAVLGQAGISAAGPRLGHIMHRAEVDAVVCSGARRGKQFTYALLVERAPQARLLARDEALAELTRRYFTSHGPATAHDFAWWSGLTVADARAGLEMNRPHLAEDSINGKTYWRSSSAPPAVDGKASAHLLPPYDEYVVAYRDRGAILDPADAAQLRTDIQISPFVIDGKGAGIWRRTVSGGAVVIESAPFRPLTDAESDAFVAAAERFGAFIGMPVRFAPLLPARLV